MSQPIGSWAAHGGPAVVADYADPDNRLAWLETVAAETGADLDLLQTPEEELELLTYYVLAGGMLYFPRDDIPADETDEETWFREMREALCGYAERPANNVILMMALAGDDLFLAYMVSEYLNARPRSPKAPPPGV